MGLASTSLALQHHGADSSAGRRSCEPDAERWPEWTGHGSERYLALEAAGLKSRGTGFAPGHVPNGGHERPELSTSSAHTVAAPRVSTPSFSNISCTCFLMVDSVMPRIVAMSEFVLP